MSLLRKDFDECTANYDCITCWLLTTIIDDEFLEYLDDYWLRSQILLNKTRGLANSEAREDLSSLPNISDLLIRVDSSNHPNMQ